MHKIVKIDYAIKIAFASLLSFQLFSATSQMVWQCIKYARTTGDLSWLMQTIGVCAGTSVAFVIASSIIGLWAARKKGQVLGMRLMIFSGAFVIAIDGGVFASVWAAAYPKTYAFASMIDQMRAQELYMLARITLLLGIIALGIASIWSSNRVQKLRREEAEASKEATAASVALSSSAQ